MGALLSKIGLPVTPFNAIEIGITPDASRGLVEVGRSFGQVLQGLQAAVPKVDLTKISAQALSLLQSGMPLSTIVNQIAQSLAGKVAAALSSAGGQLIDNVSKNKLLEAFASARAPPGGSPPGSSAEQAQALADRLQQLVANLAGEAAANAGQQNRFAGPVLDATTAKEIPAMQQNDPTVPTGSAALVSFIESVLADAAAALQASAGASNPPATQANVPGQLQTLPILVGNQAIVQSLVQAAPAPTGASSQDPGEVLGRIIARAAVANARFSGVSSATANAAGSKPQGDPATSGAQPIMVRASIQNLVAAVVQSAANQNGNATGNSTQNGSSFNWNPSANAALHVGVLQSVSSSADGGSFAAQTNALLGQSWTPAAATNQVAFSPGQPLAYTTVDANSIIDQVVKGLQVKSFGSQNSEVRMRLSPENLGDVSVKLSMNGANINASITAQNADVRDILLANQNQLSRSLADAGLKLSNFSVNVSGGGAQGFSQHQDLGRNAGTRLAFRIGAADAGQNDVLPATPTFGPPLAAVQTLGLLNYLA
ncbi:MAG: hypothetical protein NVSMB31_13850 [Vulcanimicrobiaceae bacterium]